MRIEARPASGDVDSVAVRALRVERAAERHPVELAEVRAHLAHDRRGQAGHRDDDDVVDAGRPRGRDHGVGVVERVVAGLGDEVVHEPGVAVEEDVLGAHDPVDGAAARGRAGRAVDVAAAGRPHVRCRGDRAVVALALVLVAERDERGVGVVDAQLVGEGDLHREAGVAPLLRRTAYVGGVVGVEEPHPAARRDVLQQDGRHPAGHAVEVGDRERARLEQLPHVGAPADGVDRRAGGVVHAGVGLPRGPGELLEAHGLRRLELLEAHHVERVLGDELDDPLDPHDAGVPALAVAAGSGVVGAEHVEGGRAEERRRRGLQGGRRGRLHRRGLRRGGRRALEAAVAASVTGATGEGPAVDARVAATASAAEMAPTRMITRELQVVAGVGGHGSGLTVVGEVSTGGASEVADRGLLGMCPETPIDVTGVTPAV